MGGGCSKTQTRLTRDLPHDLGTSSARESLIKDTTLLLRTDPNLSDIMESEKEEDRYSFNYIVMPDETDRMPPTAYKVAIVVVHKNDIIFKIETPLRSDKEMRSSDFKKAACEALNLRVGGLLARRLEHVSHAEEVLAPTPSRSDSPTPMLEMRPRSRSGLPEYESMAPLPVYDSKQ